MARETLEAVKQAEENAIKAETEAEEQCRTIFEDAGKEKKRILEALKANSRENYDRIVREAQREGDTIKGNAGLQAAEQMKALEAAAREAMPAAADAVIGMIL